MSESQYSWQCFPKLFFIKHVAGLIFSTVRNVTECVCVMKMYESITTCSEIFFED